jgi:hypothetical protein
MQWQPLTGTIGAPAKPDRLPDYRPGPVVSYRRQWLLLTLLCVTAAWFKSKQTLEVVPGPTFAPMLASEEGADWYFVLRLPEALPNETAQSLLRQRVDSWLAALTEAGFRPLRLSEALATLSEERPLPSKSLVLLFEPGMRRTYECLGPVLQKYHWPAVWLTDHAVLDHPDPTYISPHLANSMKSSGYWELAYLYPKAGTFLLDIDQTEKKAPSWLRPIHWDNLASRQGINRGLPQGALDHLNANLAWTGPQLVNMLMTNIPMQKQAKLTYIPLGHHFVGTVTETSSRHLPPPFQLEPNTESRSTTLTWPGTRGVFNSRLDMRVASWVGELCVLLRANPDRGESIRVAIKEGSVLVRSEQATMLTSLARWPLPLLKNGPIHAVLTLVDNQLKVVVNGHAFPTVDIPPSITPAEEALVQFSIQDRVRGVAQASAVDLTLTSLDSSFALALNKQ